MKIFLVSLCLTVCLYSNTAFGGAFDQLPGGSVYVPPVSGPECVSGCNNGDTGGGSPWSWAYSGYVSAGGRGTS